MIKSMLRQLLVMKDKSWLVNSTEIMEKTNFFVRVDTNMSSRKDFKKYLIKFKTFQVIGNPVNTTKQGLDAGWFKLFQVRILFQWSLVHNGHLTKEEKGRGRGGDCVGGHRRKMFPHRGGMSSINRPWDPEQKGPQSGWVPPLSVWEGWAALRSEGRARLGEGSL